jgi:hypothetical protein
MMRRVNVMLPRRESLVYSRLHQCRVSKPLGLTVTLIFTADIASSFGHSAMPLSHVLGGMCNS